MSGASEPPKTRSKLRAVADRDTDAEGSLIYAGWRASGLTQLAPKISHTNRSEWDDDFKRLSALDPGVALGVITRPFKRDVDVSAEKRWTPKSDIPQAGISSGPSGAVTLPVHVFKDLSDRVKAVFEQSSLNEGKARLAEIFAQADSPTIFLALAISMDPDKHAITCALIDMVSVIVADVIHDLKSRIGVDRPSVLLKTEFGKNIQPWLPNPHHTSYPGGHSALAYAMALVLEELTDQPGKLQDVAKRITENRQFAALHTSLDSDAGKIAGEFVAKFILSKKTESTPNSPYRNFAALWEHAAREWTKACVPTLGVS